MERRGADEGGEMKNIFNEIRKERVRQDKKFGLQDHPMINKDIKKEKLEEDLKKIRFENDFSRPSKGNCWYYIFAEEILEAFSETEPEKQREEMIQVAAVAVAIIECLDRKIKSQGRK